MQLSASFCRTQQALHDERASNAVLDNVRIVSGKAAIAWGLEAEVADMRETRRERARARLAADGPAAADAFEDEDSPMFSEKLEPGLDDD